MAEKQNCTYMPLFLYIIVKYTIINFDKGT